MKSASQSSEIAGRLLIGRCRQGDPLPATNGRIECICICQCSIGRDVRVAGSAIPPVGLVGPIASAPRGLVIGRNRRRGPVPVVGKSANGNNQRHCKEHGSSMELGFVWVHRIFLPFFYSEIISLRAALPIRQSVPEHMTGSSRPSTCKPRPLQPLPDPTRLPASVRPTRVAKSYCRR